MENFSEKNHSEEITVNKEALRQAEAIYQKLGLDKDTAINLFLAQTVKEQSLPLDFKQKEKTEKIEEDRELEELNKDFGWLE